MDGVMVVTDDERGMNDVSTDRSTGLSTVTESRSSTALMPPST